jgi:hypothetical protein
VTKQRRVIGEKPLDKFETDVVASNPMIELIFGLCRLGRFNPRVTHDQHMVIRPDGDLYLCNGAFTTLGILAAALACRKRR